MDRRSFFGMLLAPLVAPLVRAGYGRDPYNFRCLTRGPALPPRSIETMRRDMRRLQRSTDQMHTLIINLDSSFAFKGSWTTGNNSAVFKKGG